MSLTEKRQEEYFHQGGLDGTDDPSERKMFERKGLNVQ